MAVARTLFQFNRTVWMKIHKYTNRKRVSWSFFYLQQLHFMQISAISLQYNALRWELFRSLIMLKLNSMNFENFNTLVTWNWLFVHLIRALRTYLHTSWNWLIWKNVFSFPSTRYRFIERRAFHFVNTHL